MSAVGLVAGAAAAVAVVLIASLVVRRPRAMGHGAPGRSRGPQRGSALVLTVGGALVAVAIGGPLLLLAWIAARRFTPRLVAKRRRRAHRQRIDRAIPELVDLFGVAASAGHPPAMALLAVGRRAPPAVRPHLVAAWERFRRGLPLDDSLAELGRVLGPTGASLTDALRRAAATGAPMRPLLDAASAEARDTRRRRAQAAARRLPVSMLLPLVGCILPAAMLLAVVPVLLVSLRDLRP